MGQFYSDPDLVGYIRSLEQRINSLERQTQQAQPPMADVYRTTDQSIPSSAFTQVSWQEVAKDTSGMWDASVPGRLTIPQEGFYIYGATVSFASNATGARLGWLRETTDGVVTVKAGDMRNATAGVGNTSEFVLSDLSYLPAGAFVDLVVWQSSGGALDLISDGTSMHAAFLGSGR